MLDREQLVEYVIEPSIEEINLHSRDAVSLLLHTAIAESNLTYIHQVGGGPALGLWQMEPKTHDDIWENYLAYRFELASAIERFNPGSRRRDPPAEHMIGNLYYACIMARLHYLRVPAPLPANNDLRGQAEYWKEHYNTPLGAGTVDGFLDKVTA